MTALEAEPLKSALLDLVPPEGERVTNHALIDSFIKLTTPGIPESEDDRRKLYWTLRNELIDEGDLERGKGQGGSVRRAAKVEPTLPEGENLESPANVEIEVSEAATAVAAAKELDLYDPFIQALKTGYISEYKVPKDHLFVKTAHAGSKNTGGKWTRPDVALVAVHSYPFLPNKHLEVTTFEIKKSIGEALEGVFEALAHSAFAHRTYLAVKVEGTIPKDQTDSWTRVREECDRLAIGLIKFSNPNEYETFEFISEATSDEPELFKVNDFILKQIPEKEKETIREWVR